jgi:hypothetical protein
VEREAAQCKVALAVWFGTAPRRAVERFVSDGKSSSEDRYVFLLFVIT